MNPRSLAVTAVVLMLAVSFCVCSDTSDAQKTPSGDIDWNVPGTLSLDANQTKTITVSLYNLQSAAVHVKLAVEQIDSATVTIADSDIILKPRGQTGDREYVTVTVTSDRFSNHQDTSMVFTITSYNTVTKSTETSSLSTHVTISSKYASDSSIGKILAVFDNPLPEPFDNVLSAAVITLLLWVAISSLGSSLVRIGTQYALQWLDKSHTRRSDINVLPLKKTWKYIFGIIMMYGIANTMAVIGVDESVIGTFTNITDIITILFVGMTIWHIFTTVAYVISDMLTDGDEGSSLIPLILLLGRIIIFVGTTFALMRTSGIDMTSLALALTFAATGVSLGAKTLITQFFCGVQIMILRTFRSGDKIRVGTDNTTLVVKDVGIMTTRCKNWSNEEIYYVPNSTLADAKIVNVTKDNVFYKVYDYYGIAHDADIARAREIMTEVAYQDEGVVSDDSFPKPDVRFNGVDRDSVSLRLAYTVIDHEDYGSISARIRRRIFDRFVEEGIEIPYPQYTVNIVGAESKKDSDRDEWE